jgi:hypothetical protein
MGRATETEEKASEARAVRAVNEGMMLLMLRW